MTHREIIRKFFEPFQNLNMVVLMDNLRMGNAITGSFLEKKEFKRMCPLSHGLRRLGNEELDLVVEAFGSDWNEFTEVWDSGELCQQELLTELEAIYAERLADADAVQEVIAPLNKSRKKVQKSACNPVNSR